MYRFLDLFAGCGGMSLGFTYAGFDLRGGIEVDSTAIKTHANNFFRHSDESTLKRHSVSQDITKLSPEKFMKEILCETNPFGLIDVIVGGPPCQAFARIGRAKLREIMDHPEAFLTDERASMYLHYLRYVEFFRPLAIVIENVPDIMNYGGTNIAEGIAFSLEKIGYESRYTIMNSAHYGVPQMRQRFFLMATRKDLEIIPEFPMCTHYVKLPQGYCNAHMVALGGIEMPTLFNSESIKHHYITPPKLDPNLPEAVSVQQALHDIPPINVGSITKGARKFNKLAKYSDHGQISDYAKLMRQWPKFESKEGIFDHVTRYLPRDYKIFRKMNPGDQYPEAYKIAEQIFEKALTEYELITGISLQKHSSQFEELRAKFVPPYDPGKFPNKWRKMEADAPSRTLTAHIGKDTYSHIHYDSEQSRVISVREAARLQSFPDGFKFEGAMNAAFKQIGNAVPPLQAFAIAVKLKQLLDKAFLTKKQNHESEKLEYIVTKS
ncbi:DNA cytosine methyltransferase [Pleurocapsa sp. FMAR1]|uniref:DNA cytosine methyltransferase n=1 Tax=Pleurocapsa sp. FMAR1 TaxID=3040204 RepID=UPI0029C6E10A|nr:DNA cytosine methyltransferase [Pleurocapsa sp. FMAR1]